MTSLTPFLRVEVGNLRGNPHKEKVNLEFLEFFWNFWFFCGGTLTGKKFFGKFWVFFGNGVFFGNFWINRGGTPTRKKKAICIGNFVGEPSSPNLLVNA